MNLIPYIIRNPGGSPAGLSYYRSWASCPKRATLDAEAPVPVGRMRFTVTDGKISAVLVDSWEVTYPPFEYLRWIKAERPESFDTVFAGRWTEPRYSADAAFALLDLATEFAATAS